MPTSPMLVRLGLEFVDGRELSSSTIVGHLNRVASADLFVVVLIAFLNSVLSPRELAIQGLSGYNSHMRVGAYGGILLLLP